MNSRTRFTLAVVAAVIAAILGSITLFRISFPNVHLDWPIIREMVLPKLRVVAVGDCNFLYDRDTGVLVTKVCKTDPPDLQAAIGNLRSQVETLERQRRDFEAQAKQVPELTAELARQRAAFQESIDKQRKLLDEITSLKRASEKRSVPTGGPTNWFRDNEANNRWFTCLKSNGVTCKIDSDEQGQSTGYSCDRVGVSKSDYENARRLCDPILK